MFELPMELSERLNQALSNRVCTASDGSYIRRSSGRRRSGRNSRYFVHMEGGESFSVIAPHDNAAVELANKRAAQHRVQRTGGTYPLKIDDGAELVVVKQYDSAGDEISISNILPPSTTSR